LPINNDELDEILADLHGRDKEGRLIQNQLRSYYTSTKRKINIVETNYSYIKKFNADVMPPDLYGDNPNVFKVNGEIYKGTLHSYPRQLVPGEEWIRKNKMSKSAEHRLT
jgi:hypothetical protein